MNTKTYSNPIFHEKLNQLCLKLISFHDTKAQSEAFISEDYLNYLSLKYAAKTYDEICIQEDVQAIEEIYMHL